MTPLDATSRNLIGLFSTCLFVNAVVVGLRFLVRYRKGQRFGWDDGFMLVASSCLVAFTAIITRIIQLGATQILTVRLSPDDMLEMFKLTYVSSLVYETINISVKVSLCFFYCRIFTAALFRKQAFFVGALCTAKSLAAAIAIIFQCLPVRKAWYKTIDGHCIDLNGLVLGGETANLLLDILLIVLPIRMIQTLKLTRRQKVLLSSIFVLGGFVCIASILRIYYVYKAKDPRDLMVQGSIWSCVSISSAVLCGNLPVLKPLFTGAMVPTPVRNAFNYMVSKSQMSRSTKPTHSKDIIEVRASNDEIPLTIGGGGQIIRKSNGEKDLYPLHSFNTTVAVMTVEDEENKGSRPSSGYATTETRYSHGV